MNINNILILATKLIYNRRFSIINDLSIGFAVLPVVGGGGHLALV